MYFNKLAACCVIAAVPGLASADILSFTIGGGVWNETPEGNIINQERTHPTSVDVKNQLFWTEESQGYLFATLEHPGADSAQCAVDVYSLDHAGSGDYEFRIRGQTMSRKC